MSNHQNLFNVEPKRTQSNKQPTIFNTNSNFKFNPFNNEKKISDPSPNNLKNLFQPSNQVTNIFSSQTPRNLQNPFVSNLKLIPMQGQKQLKNKQQKKIMSPFGFNTVNKSQQKIQELEKEFKKLRDFFISNRELVDGNTQKIKVFQKFQKLKNDAHQKYMVSLSQSLQQKISTLSQENNSQKKIIQKLQTQIRNQNLKIDNLTNYINLIIFSINSLHKINQPQILKYKNDNQQGEQFYLQQKQFKKPIKKSIDLNQRDPQKSQVHPLSRSEVFSNNKNQKDQILKNSFTSRNQDSKVDYFKKKNQVKIQKYGDYYVTSQRQKNSTLASNVTIENRYGKITFTQPIQLENKQIQECIQIKQDSADVLEEDWKKNCRIEIFNFKDFKHIENQQNREEFRNEIIQEMEKDEIMKFQKLDEITGNLKIEMRYH